MMNESMEILREKLNSMLISGNASKEEILKVSNELDILIVEAIKKKRGGSFALSEAKMEELEMLLNKLQVFKKMYQSMRIIDPVAKKVLALTNDELSDLKVSCYSYWGKQNFCRNCISARAYNKDDTVFKLEIKGDSIYMITAVPIVIKGKRLVVELLKDVSESLVLGNLELSNGSKVYTMVEYMNQVAAKDTLTDLFNRRYIDERMPTEILKASADQKPLSFIFADLDAFKLINDTYGHSVGDQILSEFAKLIKCAIRKERDWAARYGGDEFFICLPGTGKKTAMKVAERIRKCLEQKEFKAEDSPFKVTCSFGVDTVCCNGNYHTVKEIMESIDRMLYMAKSKGRNQVVG